MLHTWGILPLPHHSMFTKAIEELIVMAEWTSIWMTGYEDDSMFREVDLAFVAEET